MDGNTGIARTRYDEDFIAWAREQAVALRARDFDAVDWDHVAEEMESLGNSDLAQLESRLIRLISHMLKLEYGLNDDPKRQWRLTVSEQRRSIRRLLKRMPSLRAQVPGLIDDLYADAREEALEGFAAYEPGRLSDYERTIPVVCAYSVESTLGS